jgi:hypothetical protein
MKVWKQQVEFVLEEFPETRSDDRKLCNKLLTIYWMTLQQVNYVQFVLTVVKARQKIQREWKCLWDPEVVNHRRRLSAIIKSEQVMTKKQAERKSLMNY